MPILVFDTLSLFLCALLYAVIYLGATNAPMTLRITALITPFFTDAGVISRSGVFQCYRDVAGEFARRIPIWLASLISCNCVASLLLANHRPFTKQLFKELPIVGLAIAGYLLLLLVIAMPNEYRLFLPLLPIVLWRIEETRLSPA